ncbi:MAG: HAMP domain-containing sensor histidine kinase [Myxococcota bacterium]
MPRSLVAGVALTAALVGFTTLLGLATVFPSMRRSVVAYQLSAIDREDCERAPESWGWRSGEVSFYAYDTNGRSQNPAAPRMEPDLLEQALTHELPAVRRDDHRVVVVRVQASSGPCALLRVTSRNSETQTSSTLLTILGGSTLLSALIAMAAMLWLVVRPLRRRILALADAANRVGEGTFDEPAPNDDALGAIGAVLSASHARLVDARSALEERNRALEDHLAGIAHDLRTPLSSMHLALESVAAESEGTLHEEANQALADAVYLSSLVENLHHGTRLRHAVDVTEGRVELGELVRRIEQRFSIIGRHANVSVAASVPSDALWTSCRPALAERAIANLVQNAVEHGARPGNVAITLEAFEEGRRFSIVVADDGPGIGAEALEELASLDAETFLVEAARTRGPGLGMLITSEIVRRAGWTITYERTQPTGFRVSIEGACTD